MTETKVTIDGMMCGMCEAHINDAVRRNFNVKKVTSSHSKGMTTIISESALDTGKLKEIIESTGYKMTGVTQKPYVKKGLFK